MKANISPQHIQTSGNIDDFENLLRQLIDKSLQLNKEIEVKKKKLKEKNNLLATLKTSHQWLIHEVTLLEKEKSQYESST